MRDFHMTTKLLSARVKTALKNEVKIDLKMDLTMADLLVLSLLSERAMHGYELLREFDEQEVTEWARVSRPHVYYALQKLARHALIVPVPEEASTRGRTIYQVSAVGKAMLRKDLGRIQWAKAKAPAPFSSWYGLSIHTSQQLRRKVLADRTAFLKAEIERKKKTMAFIRSYKSVRAQTGLELVQLYIEQCRTELRWIKTLVIE
jgi:DNA-binding PadR family transcriptional regulator